MISFRNYKSSYLIVLCFVVLMPYTAPAVSLNYLFKPLYAFSVIFCFSSFLLLRNLRVPFPIAIVFFLSLISAILSTVLGVFHGWFIVDIIADLLRYLAPILAFILFYNLINENNSMKVFCFIINFAKVLFIVSLSIKLFQFGQSQKLVTYGHFQIYFLPILAMYWLVYKNSYIAEFIFILSPFLVLSKTQVISNILLVFFRRGVLVTACATLLIYLFYSAYGSSLGGRWGELIYTLRHVDAANLSGSSGARLGEAINAILTMNENVYTLILGQGNGALWYQKYATISSGLSPNNFRPDGGAHHIHLTGVAILFRNGMLGLIGYVMFIGYLLYRFHLRSDLYAKMGKFLIIYCSVVFLFTYSIYGEIIFGLSVAVLLRLSMYFVDEDANNLAQS